MSALLLNAGREGGFPRGRAFLRCSPNARSASSCIISLFREGPPGPSARRTRILVIPRAEPRGFHQCVARCRQCASLDHTPSVALRCSALSPSWSVRRVEAFAFHPSGLSCAVRGGKNRTAQRIGASRPHPRLHARFCVCARRAIFVHPLSIWSSLIPLHVQRSARGGGHTQRDVSQYDATGVFSGMGLGRFASSTH